MRRAVLSTACVLLAVVAFAEHPAHAQTRDSLLNGALIGAAVGAAGGVLFTHAVRDSDLEFGQYARGALVFGAIGAGVGLGVDALLNRTPYAAQAPPRRVAIVPRVWRNVAHVVVKVRF